MSSRTSTPTNGHGKTVGAQEYWAGKLSGGLGFANLNPDRARPALHDACAPAGLTVFAFPAKVNRHLERVTGGTPFLLYTALMAALKVCLFKYTGSRTVTVGSPARRRPGTEPSAAFALAIRDELDETLTFRELLLRVRETLLEAYAGQSYNHERVIRDLGLERVENRCPLFDVALVLEDIHELLPELQNDVTIRFARGDDDGISGRIEFASCLFDHATIERFTDHYGRALLCGLLRPETKLGDIELLTEDERQRMLVAWNETATFYPQDESFHELFEQQARNTPDALALVFNDERVSYQELNGRANQLAHHLRSLGVGAEVLVGLCLERSVEMVVGLLAILKAGGAYLPLDPTYPLGRLSFMLEDARLRFLLTQSHLAEILPLDAAHVIRMDADAVAVARHSAANLECLTTHDNAAYVIYTSGSTGRPKGVVLEHGGLRNLAAAQSQTYRLPRDARVLQFASLSFDASVAEVTLALGAGATLCLVSQETLIPGADFVNFLREQHINNVTLPPSALAAMPLEDLPELETIIVAGEACPSEVVARWATGRRFFNAYGPTETTVWATVEECDAGGGAPPIGRPIANAAVYLLDAYLRPAPVGVAAQLLIGGAGLARGYLGRPALTAEKFVPDPFSTEPGSRLYKTGDVARYLCDGRIEFLGRADQQVKVRGYRIELGEVETALGAMAGVCQCVVTALEAAAGDWRLVAYVVADEGVSDAPGAGELRDRLREQLPDYMIPSAFVFLEEMPLTLNGKIDRNALPSPEVARHALGGSSDVVHSPVEEVLAGICAEVLGLERVGVDENFFELGGHSLLATSVFSRLREAFRIDLPIKTLFESPTVAQLARNVETAMRAGSNIKDLPLRPITRGAQLPLSFAQQRMWFLHHLDPSDPLYNIPIALRLTGELDLEVLKRALDEIVRRHEALRTTFEATDGVPAQVVSRERRLILNTLDLSALPQDEREAETHRLASEEARRPFDLGRGPLIRVTLLRRDEREHVLLFTMHHIISDGWSLGVLIREVAALYDAYLNGLPSPLTELPVQYADYAYWQREWLQGEALENQLAYWRAQLDGAPATLEIPSSRPRPGVQGHRGSFAHIQLSNELTTELKALGRREGATLFMVLLAAFQTLLHRYTGQDKIVVGSPTANRNRREIEGLIGCFLNVLALHTDVSGNPGFRELLGRVRQVALGAYAHQDMPFEKLIAELQLERELSHAPLFQAVFVLQNMPMGRLELTGLAIDRLDVQRGTTQSDLYFSLTETEQGLTGTLKYNSDLYDASLIERMLRDYRIILNEISARPELRLLDIPLHAEGRADYELSAAAAARNAYLKDQFAF